jgi:hypothetical protein
MSDNRIKGQEISLRIINSGQVVSAIDSISSFNEEISLEIKEAGYLGEFVNRFTEILNGYGGDCEINLTKANGDSLDQAIVNRATRVIPDLVFNIVRTDFYPDGTSNIYTYTDVSFGAIPTTVGSRGDFVKKKFAFKCSERPVATNALP